MLPVATGDAAGFADEWARLGAGIRDLGDAFARELDAAWDQLEAILTAQADGAREIRDRLPALTPEDHIDARTMASRVVLLDAIDRWDRERPLRRAEVAVETLFRGLNDLPRRIPAALIATGAEVVLTVGEDAGSRIARAMLRRRTAPETIPIHAALRRSLERSEPALLQAAGMILAAMARGAQGIRRTWDATRHPIDTAVASLPTASLPAAHDAVGALAVIADDVGLARAYLRRELDAVVPDVADGLVRSTGWRRVPRIAKSDERGALAFEHWAEQTGALEAELRFERVQDAAERELLGLGDHALADLDAERAALIASNGEFVDWIDAQVDGKHAGGAPPSGVPLVPALRRMTDFATRVQQIHARLPDEVELVQRVTALPRRRPVRKSVRPVHTAVRAFESVGRARVGDVFVRVQADHVALVQQFERARQVIEFAAEEPDSADGAAVAGEALDNARSLLAVDVASARRTLVEEHERLTRALVDVVVENRLLLGRTRFGALAHLGRVGATQGMTTAIAAAMAGTGRAMRSTGGAIRSSWRRVLVAIEWIPASAGTRPDVVRREYLPTEFTRDPRTRELPAIYRRLFRFDAVDDPRFLVGREHEMQALAEARTLWESDRPVALLVVGDRGSGKTSLINCALEGPLADLPVVRGEFRERLASAEAVREFLATLCGTTTESLEETLRSGRRVIVLEETERAFLREMGGFEGIHELQRLIASTGSSTLWLLVTNQHAFRFLDRAVRLGGTFSHRLDAASANPAAIREAILVRHHLSGLRLRFLPPPVHGGVVAQLRRRVAGEGDPEEAFFESLARESAGVFRTAFELWLGQIGSVNAGTMVMKPITPPDIDAVIEQLDADDLFTLVAIKQHGSLTPSEHAAVFRWTPSRSRAQLDELLAREIIEAEPGRPGFRVRPGALRVAREALHRRNLG